jgi:hypothetical protein
MAIQRRRRDVELSRRDRRRRRPRRTSVTPNAEVTPDITPNRPGSTPATPERRRGFARRLADALRRTGRRIAGTSNDG